MTDVLERAESGSSAARWHPSLAAPPGLHRSAARSGTRPARRPEPPPSPGWHPSSGPNGSPKQPEREPSPERAPSAPRQRKVRVGPPPRRSLLLIIATALALAVLGARLVQVQLIDRETYAALGERQGTAQWELESVRGAILDRNLNMLAVSDHLPTIWADPRLVVQPYQTAMTLASVLDIDADVIAERLASDRHFVYVARQVSPSQGRAVQDLELAGVGVRGESSRLRPNGDDFARGLLGATDIDQNPLGGAEEQFAEVLGGSDGREVARIAQSGMPLPTGTELFEPVSHGDDVVLTLHTQMQWVAERSLSNAVRSTGARGGMVVVMEVNSGDVLALAAVARNEDTDEIRPVAYNPAYVDAFEPGSVAKTFTIATALERGITSPDELHTTPRRYTVADKEFVEPYSKADREMTTTDILIHSSNIGTIKIAERVGASEMQRSLRSFGFGRLTGTDDAAALPGESRGILRSANQWRGTDLATIAFGQGIAVTAIQLAAAYNTIANDGVHVTPRLVLGSVAADGSLRPAEAAATRRVLSPQTAAQMQEILAGVVREGTGKRAAVEGYQTAGKTGTAQKPSPEGGYTDGAYTSSFAGFLPADRPELTVVAVLDEPDEYRAGIVAAPVFAEVAEYALRMLGVSPDV